LVRKAVFIPLGIMLGAAAIGLSYPFLTGVPGAEQNIIPRFASQWHVGKGAEAQPAMQYMVKHQQSEFLAELEFLGQSGDEQEVHLTIDDKKSGRHIEQTLKIGKAYVFVGPSDEMRPYVEVLDRTILSVRDTVVESKYLVVGAEWGTTFIGKFTPKMKVTEYKDAEFEFGKLKTFTVSYKVNEIENYFLVADGLPLPVRSEFHTINGDLEYSYELVGLDMPSR
jgi:hypothetical protein